MIEGLGIALGRLASPPPPGIPQSMGPLGPIPGLHQRFSHDSSSRMIRAICACSWADGRKLCPCSRCREQLVRRSVWGRGVQASTGASRPRSRFVGSISITHVPVADYCRLHRSTTSSRKTLSRLPRCLPTFSTLIPRSHRINDFRAMDIMCCLSHDRFDDRAGDEQPCFFLKKKKNPPGENQNKGRDGNNKPKEKPHGAIILALELLFQLSFTFARADGEAPRCGSIEFAGFCARVFTVASTNPHRFRCSFIVHSSADRCHIVICNAEIYP